MRVHLSGCSECHFCVFVQHIANRKRMIDCDIDSRILGRMAVTRAIVRVACAMRIIIVIALVTRWSQYWHYSIREGPVMRMCQNTVMGDGERE